MTTVTEERHFLARIQSALATAQAWDADPSLLKECRAQIDFEEVISKCQEEDAIHLRDSVYPGNYVFLKHFTRYFKENCMKWVNSPPCVKCGGEETESRTTRGPETQEEQAGGASRVEVYYCPTCQDTTTTFPRYNNVSKLLETRQGRCGEFANLFGFYCRAVGFETRYCSDFTDHVWVECYVDGNWAMADACEGLTDIPSMYESGWGKKLNYVIGATVDSVVDVTPRYTRQWFDPDFQARRRAVCLSEDTSQQIVQQVNAKLRQNLTKSRCDELDRRMEREQHMFGQYHQTTEWTEEEKHGQGRISGSLQWKLSRNEAGKAQEEESESPTNVVQSWHVESYYPLSGKDKVYLSVYPGRGINMTGAWCSVIGAPISMVVVDESNVGCILQSRGFSSWSDVSDFVQTLPKRRIVAIEGKAERVVEGDGLSRLKGLAVPDGEVEGGVMYLGQVDAKPGFCRCVTYKEAPDGLHVKLPSTFPTALKSLKLRTERDTVPSQVACRMPESVMPLQTQLMATEEQKRAAFLRFTQKRVSEKRQYNGYTTKPSSPVYLLDGSSYPLAKTEGGWNTFHLLPTLLVPEDDVGIVEKSGNTTHPTVDIPLDTSFFTSLLGSNLLLNSSEGTYPELVDTSDALHNARLVALYFSAHWCGPCRRFTPMLVELYEHLKEEFPSHGLEIVFVSSDRDAGSFDQYFGTMPWTAVPFPLGGAIIPQIKARYGVRGIPALVVLDAMSGQIVVPMSEARGEVTQACQGGDDRIEDMLQSWIARIPQESQEIMAMLELSCDDDDTKPAANDKAKDHPYLVRSESETEKDPSELIKETFAKLVSDGLEPNAAAAKAIQMLADQKQAANETVASEFDGAPSEYESTAEHAANNLNMNQDTSEDMRTVFSTALKYLGNAKKEPWTPKFRTFRLSNKVMDRITRIEDSLRALGLLGWDFYPTEADFMASIPLAADLDKMEEGMNAILSSTSNSAEDTEESKTPDVLIV